MYHKFQVRHVHKIKTSKFQIFGLKIRTVKNCKKYLKNLSTVFSIEIVCAHYVLFQAMNNATSKLVRYKA